MSKLKPCIVFDIDGTLVETPTFDWYTHKSGGCEAPLLNATPIKEMMFLYHAVDYLINDPPTWAIEEGLVDKWPKDIFFLTARSEELRESTVQCISKHTHDSGTSISKRLFMRPSSMNDVKVDSSYNVKTLLVSLLRAKGYDPTMVFDNDHGSASAYLDAGVKVVNKTIAENMDKELHTEYSLGESPRNFSRKIP